MFSLKCFAAKSIFVLIRQKMWEKMKPIGFALRWPCDPMHDLWKQLKVTEVSEAYMHGRSEKKQFAYTVQHKAFTTQDGRPVAGRPNMTHYIAHMDKKKKSCSEWFHLRSFQLTLNNGKQATGCLLIMLQIWNEHAFLSKDAIAGKDKRRKMKQRSAEE